MQRTVNTAVLMTSSLVMGLAIHSIARGRQARTYWLLLLTAAIGLIFIGLKFTEYFLHYQDRKVPGIWFESSKPYARQEELFFVFYFALTGLHVIHMSIGIGLVAVVATRTALGRFSAFYHTPIDIVGMYWHFVDIVWIFIYASLYVTGFH